MHVNRGGTSIPASLRNGIGGTSLEGCHHNLRWIMILLVLHVVFYAHALQHSIVDHKMMFAYKVTRVEEVQEFAERGQALAEHK